MTTKAAKIWCDVDAPWELAHADKGVQVVTTGREPQGCVATVWGVGRDKPNTEQYAKLLTAAPELAAALVELLEHSAKVNHAFYVKGTTKAMREAMLGQKELLDDARQALAKAGIQ